MWRRFESCNTLEDVHTFARSLEGCPPGADLVLDGEELELQSVTIDGIALPGTGYTVSAKTMASTTLTVLASSLPPADDFVVETTVVIRPNQNVQGNGLYFSPGSAGSPMLVTQCEPQGVSAP